MNKYNKSVATSPCNGQFNFWLPLFISLFSGNVWGLCTDASHGIVFSECVSGEQAENCSYAVQENEDIGSQMQTISASPEFDPTSISWSLFQDATHPLDTCTHDPFTKIISCFGVTFNYSGNPVSLGGMVSGVAPTNGEFTLQVTDGTNTCHRTYEPHISSSASGWGDPHIVTVDNVEYDFQSVGEFIALRSKDVEIQTRSAPYPTSSGPIQDRSGYTDLKNCLAVYSGIAARVGNHPVTIQSNFGSDEEGSPDGPQIRVDGTLVTLPPEGIDLTSCDCGHDDETSGEETEGSHSGDCECNSGNTRHVGRIFYVSGTKNIEIDYDSGTRVVVVPRWLSNLKMWFFNLNIYDTTAKKGIMGHTVNNWLPAKFDGTSVGEREVDDDKRHAQVYKEFADSWRVNSHIRKKKSLFDYKPGESTDNFTNKDWTRKDRESCTLGSEPVANPLPVAEAQQACKNVMDETNKANCVYDVEVTGNTEFADAYEQSEQAIPGLTQTKLVQDKNPSSPGSNVTFTANVTRAASATDKVTSGRVQFILDGSNAGNSIALNANGIAQWSTTSIPLGDHEVEAKFVPTGFGEQFRPSSSKVSHTVAPNKWWGSVHAGTTNPTGNFSNSYDPSYSTVLDVEYRFTPKYSFLGLLGYNHFKGASTGIDDTYWINLSADLRYYFAKLASLGNFWVNAGVGAYIPKTGSTELGANFGVGLSGNINPELRWEVGVNYHNIFTSGGDTKFFVPTVGVSYKF